MDNKIKQYLFDIDKSIRHVETFISAIASFEDYCNDLLIKRAVEREIEIIGEATNRILKLDPEIKISNAREIVNTRNKIIHGYDEIDDVIIYVVATKKLAELKEEISKL